MVYRGRTGEPRWEIKVTAKGQITLPKEARDAMMVREGDHLEAMMQDDAIVLRRRDSVPEDEKIRMLAARNLRSIGIDPDRPPATLAASNVRSRMPVLPVEMAKQVRDQREGREE